MRHVWHGSELAGGCGRELQEAHRLSLLKALEGEGSLAMALLLVVSLVRRLHSGTANLPGEGATDRGLSLRACVRVRVRVCVIWLQLFQRASGAALLAPGRCVPAVLDYLTEHLQEGDAACLDVLTAALKAVVTSSNAAAEGNGECLLPLCLSVSSPS